MPSKEEKERRKEIQRNLSQKVNEEFEKSLPISRDQFKELFGHLDLKLGDQECSNSLQLTQEFLQNAGVRNIAEVRNWLAKHGGHCVCEVLANVEDIFIEGPL